MDVVNDSFSDLDLSSSDNEDSENNLTQHFNKATKYIQTIAANLNSTSLLTLYGYYKQGIEGKCSTQKPGFFDMKGKSKWDAWTKLGDMTKDEAKKLYIEEVKKIDPLFKLDTPSGSKKNKSASGWVTVSTLQKTSEDSNSSEDESEDKSCLKYFVKHSDYENVKQALAELIIDDDDCEKLFHTLDDDGLGLLHWAADRGCPKILESLLSIREIDINIQDCDGQTPLYYAVSVGHEDCVECLLKHGADPFIKAADGCDCFGLIGDNVRIKNLLYEHSNVE